MAKDFFDKCYRIYKSRIYPILFEDIKRPPIWPVIAMSVIIFLIISEVGSQNCSDGSCNHYKNINYVTPMTDPGITRDIDKVIARIRLNHTVVGWRRALILSIILSVIILFIYYRELPPGFDFFLVTTILFIIIYFSSAWLQWHWWKGRDFILEDKLLNLRNDIQSYI